MRLRYSSKALLEFANICLCKRPSVWAIMLWQRFRVSSICFSMEAFRRRRNRSSLRSFSIFSICSRSRSSRWLSRASSVRTFALTLRSISCTSKLCSECALKTCARCSNTFRISATQCFTSAWAMPTQSFMTPALWFSSCLRFEQMSTATDSRSATTSWPSSNCCAKSCRACVLKVWPADDRIMATNTQLELSNERFSISSMMSVAFFNGCSRNNCTNCLYCFIFVHRSNLSILSRSCSQMRWPLWKMNKLCTNSFSAGTAEPLFFMMDAFLAHSLVRQLPKYMAMDCVPALGSSDCDPDCDDHVSSAFASSESPGAAATAEGVACNDTRDALADEAPCGTSSCESAASPRS
mmetsp:Transcript_25357/g.76231  ORF Transcript_25357/g.76231 Transcript_25357/m.76231 type:complete len:352 (-) Transcript_25357:7-1062(-)